MNVYFICTGNTCRSPMAEALFQSKKKEGMHARSAGIFAMDGGDISRNGKQLIQEAGIEYNQLSRQIVEEDVRWADLILTMTAAHKELVMQAFQLQRTEFSRSRNMYARTVHRMYPTRSAGTFICTEKHSRNSKC